MKTVLTSSPQQTLQSKTCGGKREKLPPIAPSSTQDIVVYIAQKTGLTLRKLWEDSKVVIFATGNRKGTIMIGDFTFERKCDGKVYCND